jgi:hypothetical protein
MPAEHRDVDDRPDRQRSNSLNQARLDPSVAIPVLTDQLAAFVADEA